MWEAAITINLVIVMGNFFMLEREIDNSPHLQKVKKMRYGASMLINEQ